MKNNILKSTTIKKSVLFLFLGLLLSFSVKSQCPIIDTAIVTNVSCFGDASGSIDLVLFNPAGNYSFDWSNGATIVATTEDINTLNPGTYSVTITDLNNPVCVQDTSFTISQPQDPLSSAVNLYQNVSCFGDSTGVAYVNAIGGTLPYTYSWNTIPAQTNQIANGLWAGTHTVTITDTNGCTLLDSITIVNLHPEIIGTITVLENVSCFDACDGSAQLSSSGGVLQHTYFWDNGQTYIGSGPNTAVNLCYGGHSVIIEDALGCRNTVSFIITQPDQLFAQAIQVQPVQCYGFDDGIAFASATGGTTLYSFVWDNPLNPPTGPNINNLTPGVHTVYVTDANGCTDSDTVLITEPTQLEVIIVDTMTIYSYCNGTNSGQLCAYASGGTPNPTTGYIYQWNDALYQNTECAYNIIAQYADYTIIVMDDRNCIASASFQLDSITNSMNPDSVIVDINHVTCFGIYDGSVLVSNVVGAVAPFSYTWTGPSGYTGTGSYISSLYAGSYALIIEDSNACAITINAQVLEPEQLEYTTYNVIDETCYGACDGQIWVNVTGGTGNYYYDVTASNFFPIPAASQVQLINDSLIFNLCEGTHIIYLTDDNNCEGAVVWGGNWVEYVDSGAYFAPFPGILTVDASCFNTNDGQAWIQWPGANPLFNYTWETNPVGTVIDTGDTTSILFPGNYNLVVHYADSLSFGQNYVGCDVVYPFTIGGPGPLTAGAVVTNESCFGANDGEITLSPSSPAFGTPTVLWDTTTSIPNGSTALIQSPLQPGVYTVTITDADGCQITEDYIIAEAEPMTASISFIPPSCFGLSNGSATIITDGGTGVWTIAWSPSGGGGITTTPIGAGVYTANTTDGNGCTASFSVTVTEPEDVIAGVNASVFYNGYEISCFGFSDGTAAVTNGGGVPPYTYSWSPSGGNLQVETGMSVGLNTVTVTDGNNCTQSATITLAEPTYLDPNIFENIYSISTNGISNEISCYGLSDGWIESQTFGGVPSNVGYQYLWVNNTTGTVVSTQAIAENLPANFSYTVTVTDANGCVSTEISTVLDEPAPFIADVTTTNYGGPTHAPFSVNFVDNTVSIDPFDFTWNWQDGTESFPVLTTSMNHLFTVDYIGENSIYVIVTNLATGCTDSVPFVIDAQGVPEVNNVFTPNSDGINDGFSFGEHKMDNIDVQIFNRWGQLVYTWVGSDKSWDGKGIDGNNVAEGVYFYVLVAKGEDGHYYDHKGTITLLR